MNLEITKDELLNVLIGDFKTLKEVLKFLNVTMWNLNLLIAKHDLKKEFSTKFQRFKLNQTVSKEDLIAAYEGNKDKTLLELSKVLNINFYDLKLLIIKYELSDVIVYKNKNTKVEFITKEIFEEILNRNSNYKGVLNDLNISYPNYLLLCKKFGFKTKLKFNIDRNLFIKKSKELSNKELVDFFKLSKLQNVHYLKVKFGVYDAGKKISKEMILDLVEKGHGISAIKDMLNVEHVTLKNLIEKFEININRVERKHLKMNLLNNDENLVIDRMDSGDTYKEIGYTYQASTFVPFKFRKDRGLSKNTICEKNKDLIFELYDKGLTISEISMEITKDSNKASGLSKQLKFFIETNK